MTALDTLALAVITSPVWWVVGFYLSYRWHRRNKE